MSARCMLCDKSTKDLVKSERPRGIKDVWNVSSIMICPKCRDSNNEYAFWRGLGEEWEGKLLHRIMKKHTSNPKEKRT